MKIRECCDGMKTIIRERYILDINYFSKWTGSNPALRTCFYDLLFSL